MRYVSVLIPAFAVPEGSRLEDEVQAYLGLSQDQFSCYELALPAHYAIQLHDLRLNYQDLEKALDRSQQAQAELALLRTSLLELQRAKESEPSLDRRGRDLREENKRLKRLLHNQVQNAEKMRQDTQATVQTLKREFDLLVRELMSAQKRERQRPATNREEKPNKRLVVS